MSNSMANSPKNTVCKSDLIRMRDAAKRLTAVVQADWQVAIEYADAAADRPARLDINSGDAHIRFVIDSLERGKP